MRIIIEQEDQSATVSQTQVSTDVSSLQVLDGGAVSPPVRPSRMEQPPASPTLPASATARDGGTPAKWLQQAVQRASSITSASIGAPSQVRAGQMGGVAGGAAPLAPKIARPTGPPMKLATTLTGTVSHELLTLGVNYYPARHPWWRMWCDWDLGVEIEIANEIRQARRLGTNTVRTFLPFSAISQSALAEAYRKKNHIPPLTNSDVQRILGNLDTFLGIAESQEMSVILGLFDEQDLLPDLLTDIPSSIAYVDTVLNYRTMRGVRLGDDMRIEMWDLVNELDGVAVGPDNPQIPLFLSWLHPFAGLQAVTIPGAPRNPDPLPMRTYYISPPGIALLDAIYNRVFNRTSNEHRITFGVLNPFTSLYLLNRFPDQRHLPQYHDYTVYDPANAQTADCRDSKNEQAYRCKVSDQMNIIYQRTGLRTLIGEFGKPSQFRSADPHETVNWTPELQRSATDIFLSVLTQNTDKIVGALAWILTDFDFADAEENGEKYHGLYMADLTAKPAAQVVASAFSRLQAPALAIG